MSLWGPFRAVIAQIYIRGYVTNLGDRSHQKTARIKVHHVCERFTVYLEGPDPELLKKVKFLMSYHQVPFGIQVYQINRNFR